MITPNEKKSDGLTSGAPEGPLKDKWESYKANMKLVNPANKRKNNIKVDKKHFLI